MDCLFGIGCPTLIIAGSQDRLRSLEEAHEMHAAIPKAELEIIEAGHMIPLEAPRRLSAPDVATPDPPTSAPFAIETRVRTVALPVAPWPHRPIHMSGLCNVPHVPACRRNLEWPSLHEQNSSLRAEDFAVRRKVRLDFMIPVRAVWDEI